MTAIATLGVGIGLATAVFTVAEALLLRPLPVVDQDRLVVLWGETPDRKFNNFPVLLDETREFERRTRSLERLAAVSYYGGSAQPMREDDRLSTLNQSLVSGDFFDVLGARPVLGRGLRVDDDRTGAAPVAVLSYAAWQRRFGGDADIVGKSLTRATGTTITIVGVMPQGLDYPKGTDYWAAITPSKFPQHMFMIGRLARGATAEQARLELTSYFARADAPTMERDMRGVVHTLPELIVGDTRPALVAFVAAAALLLLITCINVANLLLVRGLGRLREVAVRSAIGASRGQVIGQLLTENCLLALAGGVIGIAVSTAAVKSFVAMAPASIPRLDEIALNTTAFVGAFAITAIALLFFAIAPAIVTSRIELQDVLRADSRQSGTRGARLAREALVAGQVALAVLVLSAAALIARSLINLERVPLSFDRSRLLIGELTYHSERLANVTAQTAFLDRLVPRLMQVPGVLGVAPVVAVPYSGAHGWDARPTAEGQSAADAAMNPMLNMEVVTPGYFATLGVPALSGRVFTTADRTGAPRVVVLSETAARHYWPAGGAIGKRLQMGGGELFTVVGIVRDTRYRELRTARPTVYFPLHQSIFPFTPAVLAVRTASAPADLIPSLRRVIAESDAGVALLSASPFEAYLEGPLAQPRLNALLLGLFAGAAVTLAAVGLFGTMAAMVRQRTLEIGVRMALGASAVDVRRMIVRRGVAVAAAGAAVGLLGALFANRTLGAMLYGISPTDGLTLAIVIVSLLTIALVASLLPARWSTRVNPVVVLRAD